MGVWLGYQSVAPVESAVLAKVIACLKPAVDSREWWCEGLWISDKVTTEGKADGGNKIFCSGADEDVDGYMTYLDICEIAEMLRQVSSALGVDWTLDIDGEDFGRIVSGQLDPQFQASLAGFPNAFGFDLESFSKQNRDELLIEWVDR